MLGLSMSPMTTLSLIASLLHHPRTSLLILNPHISKCFQVVLCNQRSDWTSFFSSRDYWMSQWFLHLRSECCLICRREDNPADQLVAVINSNRTAHKSSILFDNPGLGCIALQYIKAYQGQCDEVGDNKKPSDSSFADTFAPNCGVEAQTLAPITGRLLACQSSYVSPDQAFSDILIKNARSLQILYDKNHTQVGAAVRGTDGGAPYFWCVLFSGGKTNSTFVLEGGVAKTVRPGCFSGNNDDCSGSARLGVGLWQMVVGVLIAIACAVGL